MTPLARVISITAIIGMFATVMFALPLSEGFADVAIGNVEKEGGISSQDIKSWKRLIQFVNTQQGAITALATVVIALVTTATTFLTRAMIRENKLLRKAGTEPEVIAYLMADRRFKTDVNFVLANVGQGPARDVQFTFEANEEDFAIHEVRLSNKAERTAISMLPQGERVEAFFGVGHCLYKEPRLKPFKVSIRYKDIKGNSRNGDFELDVSQFDGLITLGNPAEHEVAEALKGIEKHLGQFATGIQKLKVETITASQVRKENEERIRRSREMKNKAKEEE